MMEKLLLLSLLMISSVVAEETDKAETEEEPLLGFLDYVLLVAIAGVCFWWFYWRDRDSDKIPEVGIKINIDIFK